MVSSGPSAGGGVGGVWGWGLPESRGLGTCIPDCCPAGPLYE